MTSPHPAAPLAAPPDVAQHLGVAEQTLAQWRWKKIGPPWTKVGGRVRYDWAEIEAWLAQQRTETE